MPKYRWYEARTEIATFALPIMKDYLIRKMGYPAAMLQEMDGDSKRAEERWDEILIRIIDALEWIVEDADETTEEDELRHQKSLELFGKWFNHLWD